MFVADWRSCSQDVEAVGISGCEAPDLNPLRSRRTDELIVEIVQCGEPILSSYHPLEAQRFTSRETC
jgi:hypothetical protein